VIVPSLNEEGYIGELLKSLKAQVSAAFEIIVVDGGSSDRTVDIGRSEGARVEVRPGLKEFPSRNLGAGLAQGEILLFTGADVVFPRRVLQNIAHEFAADHELIAVAGPGIPIRPPLASGAEYWLYNFLRFLMAKLPRPLKRFSTSTNCLAVRRDVFRELNGFEDDVNGDGLLGRRLCALGKVRFSYRVVRVYISARRLEKDGFWGFNRHFLYVFENFISFPQNLGWFRRLKVKSGETHSDMRHEE